MNGPAPTLLALGAMPQNAAPQNAIAAGPWCFAGQEDLFPGWETAFRFAPEPPGGNLEHDALAAMGLCVDNLPRVAQKICPHAENLPAVYWQTLLTPWLIDVCRQIVERSLRADLLISAYGAQEMLVPVLPEDIAFNFADEHDFTLRGSLGIQFNHWLFSRLLEPVWPRKWQKTEASFVKNENPPQTNTTSLREIARSLMLCFKFPKIKGLTLSQAIKFSLALNHVCRAPDHSQDLALFSSQKTGATVNLPFDPLPVIMHALPRSLKNLRHPANIARTSRPRIRLASITAYENAAYRQKLAAWRGAGNRLAWAQHGGNYGQILVSCDRQLVEYSQDAFFTWGWKSHGQTRGNFIPLPSPQLQAIRDKWHDAGARKLLYVGAEMPAFGYRLESRPTPLQTVAYRRDKAIFFETIGPAMQQKSFYRPYFNIPGTLEDASWLLPRFPLLRMCEGNLLPQILGSHLLVLDHHGTTMLEALAANVPLILFWRREAWPLCPECDKLLAMLANAGIWHDSPEKAAQKTREVWNDVDRWWTSPEIQHVRKQYCMEQARTQADNNVDAIWIQALKKL